MYIVKKIRLELKLTPQELADILNITRSAIYNYEQGHRKPLDEIANRMILFFKKKGYDVNLEQLRLRSDL